MSEEPSADQTDLSASPPPPYAPPPALSLSDITASEPQGRLGHSDVTESLNNPEEGEDQEGAAGFEFDDKDQGQGFEDLSRETMEQNVGKQMDQSGPDHGMLKTSLDSIVLEIYLVLLHI